MPRLRFGLLPALVLACVTAGCQTPTWRDQWDASEAMVPMRDGVKLYTVIYVPKDKPGPLPILMERTPYGAGSPTRPPGRINPKMAAAGYILVFQDVRGQGKSEGDWMNIRPTKKKGQPGSDESTDCYDTVDYLVKSVPKNSGRVGLWGISYPAFYAGAGAIRNHPALVAVSPQAPVNDWFLGDDVHHNGAFFLQETFDFALGFDVPRGTPPVRIDRGGLSAYEWYLKAGPLGSYDEKFLQGRIPYWNELMANSTLNDYWKERALWRSMTDVKCAVLTVGGWYDKENMYGALSVYSAVERQNPGIKNVLVMGPWSHGQWAGGNGSSLADLAFGSRTGQWFQENVEFPFFERYLRGDTNAPDVPEASIFETGANKWHQFSSWPPRGLRPMAFYLQGDKTVSLNAPKTVGVASYLSDPANPTPYVADYLTSRRAPGDWLARNQAFLGQREDTATFALPALTEDLAIAGPVEADMWISTTGTDCDLVVSLIDEYPADTEAKKPSGESMAGYQHMVRGNIMRARFHQSFERPLPLVPGKPTRVRFQLNDVMHTFKKGHRVLVRVQSSWFPIADRNPNQFLDIRTAKADDFRKATITIHCGGNQASAVRVSRRN